MTIRTLIAALVGTIALGASACNTSSPGGSPGTNNKFSVTGPTMATSLKQGETQIVKLTITRDKEFKQDVALSVGDTPKGITAKLDKSKVAASDPNEVSLSIEAAKDAPTGDGVIKINATPADGKPTSVDVKVTVKTP